MGTVNPDDFEPSVAANFRRYVDNGGHISEAVGQSMAAHSTAISTRRIADALEMMAKVQHDMFMMMASAPTEAPPMGDD